MASLFVKAGVVIVLLGAARVAEADAVPLWAGTMAKRTAFATFNTKPPMVFVYEMDAKSNVSASKAIALDGQPASGPVEALPEAAKARFVASRTAGGWVVAKKASVLRGLDSLCGDTWCEGEYTYRFVNIACSEKGAACTLTIKRARHTAKKKLTELRCTLFAEAPASASRAPALKDLVERGDATMQLHDRLSACLAYFERGESPG
jgi:hypothetical protein